MLLEEEEKIRPTPTSDLWTLTNAEQYDVLLLVPIRGFPHVPDEAIAAIRRHVWNGGGMIGMHDVLFLAPAPFHEIFGGTGGVFPTDAASPKLRIVVRPAARRHPILAGIPDRFPLIEEHPVRTGYDPRVSRLLDAVYTSVRGEEIAHLAAWTRRYGEGWTLYFSPGHSELTRYHPYVIRLFVNAIRHFSSEGSPSAPSRVGG
ncbi:MAG: hypothetical protein KatS3mg115_0477 [Candidatus Poribacteria bacterium]|nr:MAG: hypothetical protein KatS3mg115_0477 [Candidatus Poribacteria bacterium]